MYRDSPFPLWKLFPCVTRSLDVPNITVDLSLSPSCSFHAILWSMQARWGQRGTTDHCDKDRAWTKGQDCDGPLRSRPRQSCSILRLEKVSEKTHTRIQSMCRATCGPCEHRNVSTRCPAGYDISDTQFNIGPL